MNNMTVVYIGLGSNIGNSKKVIDLVINAVAKNEFFCLPQISSYYQSSPVGDTNQRDFLNVVLKVDTALSPKKVLEFLLLLERKAGRKRDSQRPKGPRLIDCDLLLYGREQINSDELIVPHPRMTERLFVMEPLIEIAPKAIIPIIDQSVDQSISSNVDSSIASNFVYAKDVLVENKEKGIYDSQMVKKIII